nr:three prime repair exonuclease 2-like [Lytechinus pictus]
MDSATGLTIKSFVFLDFETSHLHPTDRPKIIELSLIAINRAGLLDPDVLTSLNLAKNHENSTFDLSKVSLPRIVDKLTLCLDPGKYTSADSARLTKLDKDKLDNNKKLPFDEGVVTMLNLFLSRQDQPVCLVAHNGMRFDFPILRSELSVLTKGDPPAELYCLDTLKGFRAGFATETQGVKENAEKLIISKQNSTAWKRKLSDLECSPRPKRQRISYTLVNIFKRTFERQPPHSHPAEDDVVSLIKVLLPVISDFVSWADENASPFKDCKLYYATQPVL